MLLTNTFVFSQYLHLSNSYNNPISFIHSNAGSELRATQVGLVYRDQGNRAGNSHYKRVHFFGQRNLSNNIGLGFSFNNLTAGAGRSQYLNANLTIPYHLRISTIKSQRISIAPVGSFLQLKQNGENFRFEENILGIGGSDVNSFDKQQVFQYGGSINTELDFNRFNFQIGYEYLTKANTSVGVLLHDLHKILLKSSLKSIFGNTDFNTSILYQKSANENQLHILPSIRKNQKSNSFNAYDIGIGYRLDDGFTFLLGAEINNKYNIYFNYDYTTSGLVALNNGNGALEFGISYKFYKSLEIEKLKPLAILLPMQKIELPIQINVLTPMRSSITYLIILQERKSMEDIVVNEVKVEDLKITKEQFTFSEKKTSLTEVAKKEKVEIDTKTKSNAENNNELFSETKSFLFYHDVNDIPINTTSFNDYDKMIQFIEENKIIIDSIEIVSYTDSKGSENYNLEISDRRANSISTYLKSIGIANDKITWKGKGETNLINKCYEAENCDEIEHNENRRTEVRISIQL